jgi:hypothetical protein
LYLVQRFQHAALLFHHGGLVVAHGY